MSELRQNIATKEWVIIASERARRPNDFIARAEQGHSTTNRPIYDAQCPFCPGNEEPELEIARLPQHTPWQTRVVHNKYPALAIAGEPSRTFSGVERHINGVGHHEVLVEHPSHNTTLALMSDEEIRLVFETYQQRGAFMSRDPRIEQIIYFKNHGERAGASLMHAHSQIIGLPIVPGDIRHRIEEARRFFDDTGSCVFCTMLNDELQRNERIIALNEHFVAFVLYAASSPFHSWIMPRHHRASFQNASADELSALARIVRETLRRIYTGLNDPDLNMIIRSAPVRDTENSYFHWYISIVPRLSRSAGFELGSGVWINPILPETCAAFLHDVQI
jgi:UDPglucose--hexose-1-phosphate uridylyltransferase